MQELLTLYKLYLYALREREEYGDKYGDTDELIKMYEEKLIKEKVKIKGDNNAKDKNKR